MQVSKVEIARGKMMAVADECVSIDGALTLARFFPNKCESDAVKTLEQDLAKAQSKFEEAWDAWNLASQRERLDRVYGRI